MKKLPPNILYAYFPLWGAEIDSKDRGLIGGTVSVMIPYMDEWKLIQQSEAWEERFGNVLGDVYEERMAGLGPEPQPCLVLVYPLVSDESFLDGIERLKEQVLEEARDAMLALRLYKPGWFIDPETAEYAFVQKPRIVRSAGLYHQAFMESIPESLPARYKIKINELSEYKGAPSPITCIWNLVEQYKHIAHHTTADIAIANFNGSYGFKLRSCQRVAMLFTVLDALFGGLSTERVGRLKLNSRFRDRVYAALEAVQGKWLGTDSSPLELAQWMDTFGRRIYNGIAYGSSRDVSVESDGSWEYIQLIVRVLLRQYLEFSVKWFKNPREVGGRLGLPDSASPAVGYNLALELKAKNGLDVSDLLGFDISSR